MFHTIVLKIEHGALFIGAYIYSYKLFRKPSLSHMLKTRDCIMYYAYNILDLINGTKL